MKVIIVGPAFPLRGGIANFNESLCREFKKAGHDAQIYSFSLQYPSFLFPGTTQYDSGQAPSDINIKTCVNSINPFNWIKSAIKIKKQKPDLIIVRFSFKIIQIIGEWARPLHKNNLFYCEEATISGQLPCNNLINFEQTECQHTDACIQ